MKPFDASRFPFPLHSVTVSVDGRILQDDCFAPFEQGQMHRMFSVTKSFCSMAIGALISEGRLSLSDRITDFFPEYVPENADFRLISMTIENMLTMRTCHKATTYKVNMKENWVESFFITPPDHTPGAFFKYDTSSSHVLAALVKKLTGKGVLDYLRPVFLDCIGFSENAYILTDPFGSEMGGSGLVCLPKDLTAVSSFLLALLSGDFSAGKSLLSRYGVDLLREQYDEAFFRRFAAYMKDAVSCLVPTIAEGQTLDEQQGYGRMFWSLRPLSESESAFMMYGMGGQYCVFYPERHAIFVTTADSQNIKGGHQYILDEIRSCALTLPRINEERLLPAPSKKEGPACGSYQLRPNASGFTSLTLSKEKLCLYEDGLSSPFVFSFPADTAWGETIDPKYGQKLFSKKNLLADGSLLVDVQILSDFTGSVRFLIKTGGERIFLYSRKVEETYFNEFTGFFEGKLSY